MITAFVFEQVRQLVGDEGADRALLDGLVGIRHHQHRQRRRARSQTLETFRTAIGRHDLWASAWA